MRMKGDIWACNICRCMNSMINIWCNIQYNTKEKLTKLQGMMQLMSLLSGAHTVVTRGLLETSKVLTFEPVFLTPPNKSSKAETWAHS